MQHCQHAFSKPATIPGAPASACIASAFIQQLLAISCRARHKASVPPSFCCSLSVSLLSSKLSNTPGIAKLECSAPVAGLLVIQGSMALVERPTILSSQGSMMLHPIDCVSHFCAAPNRTVLHLWPLFWSYRAAWRWFNVPRSLSCPVKCTRCYTQLTCLIPYFCAVPNRRVPDLWPVFWSYRAAWR